VDEVSDGLGGEWVQGGVRVWGAGERAG
jgi:hypothetical protein